MVELNRKASAILRFLILTWLACLGATEVLAQDCPGSPPCSAHGACEAGACRCDMFYSGNDCARSLSPVMTYPVFNATIPVSPTIRWEELPGSARYFVYAISTAEQRTVFSESVAGSVRQWAPREPLRAGMLYEINVYGITANNVHSATAYARVRIEGQCVGADCPNENCPVVNDRTCAGNGLCLAGADGQYACQCAGYYIGNDCRFKTSPRITAPVEGGVATSVPVIRWEALERTSGYWVMILDPANRNVPAIVNESVGNITEFRPSRNLTWDKSWELSVHGWDEVSNQSAASLRRFRTAPFTCGGGRYGPVNCPNECPGGAVNACSQHGACDDGPNGDGRCLCRPFYAGADCAVVEIPEILAPAAENPIPTNPLIRWQAVANAKDYYVDIKKTRAGRSPIAHGSQYVAGDVTTLTPQYPLTAGEEYTISITARHQSSASSQRSTRTYRIAAADAAQAPVAENQAPDEAQPVVAQNQAQVENPVADPGQAPVQNPDAAAVQNVNQQDPQQAQNAADENIQDGAGQPQDDAEQQDERQDDVARQLLQTDGILSLAQACSADNQADAVCSHLDELIVMTVIGSVSQGRDVDRIEFTQVSRMYQPLLSGDAGIEPISPAEVAIELNGILVAGAGQGYAVTSLTALSVAQDGDLQGLPEGAVVMTLIGVENFDGVNPAYASSIRFQYVSRLTFVEDGAAQNYPAQRSLMQADGYFTVAGGGAYLVADDASPKFAALGSEQTLAQAQTATEDAPAGQVAALNTQNADNAGAQTPLATNQGNDADGDAEDIAASNDGVTDASAATFAGGDGGGCRIATTRADASRWELWLLPSFAFVILGWRVKRGRV